MVRLHPTAAEQLPFAKDHVSRAFLLEREAGNLLVYANGLVADGADGLAERGPVERHYLGHWHETLFGDPHAGAPVYVHEADAEEAGRRAPVDKTFEGRHRLGDDFEAIPIPGHTPGSTAYLWDSGEGRMLFTADSVYVRDGEWVAAVLDSSDRDAYVESLELIRELEFDALVPWAVTAGDELVSVVSEAERIRRLDVLIDRIRAGADE